jgi:rieske iron-sulfur protein
MAALGPRLRGDDGLCSGEGVDWNWHDRAGRIGRRAALGLGLGFLLAPRLARAQTEPARERPREGDLLVVVGASPAEALKPEDLPVGGKQTFAWPMDPESQTVRSGSRLNKVLLLRLDPEGFDAETKNHAAEGVVAYSAVCTHTGCDVVNWYPETQLLECPCHYSLYNPREGAKVVSGPSPRRLPALPLKTVENRLVVAKPFTGRAGFQQM